MWVLLQSRWRGAGEVPWHTKDRPGRRGCPSSPLAMLPHATGSQPAPHLVCWLLLPLPPGLTRVPHMGRRAHGAPTSYPWRIRGSQTEPSPAHCRVHPLRGRRGAKTNSSPDTDVKYPAEDLPCRALGLFLLSFPDTYTLSLCGFQSLAPLCARAASATVCRALTMLGLGLRTSPATPPLVLPL